MAEQAAALAKKEGQALLAQLQKSPDAVTLPDTAVIGRAAAQGVPREVIDAVLGVDAGKLPAPVGVDLGAQGYLVAKVMQVLPRDPAVAPEQMLQGQYVQAIANAEMQAYYTALKSRYKAEVKPRASALAASAPAR